MPAHNEFSLYREALLFLATAGVMAPLFVRLKVSPVLGYVLAGAALGPYGLGRLADKAPWLRGVLLSDIETIGQVAEFGVVTLMFTIGLELSFERLKSLRRLVFGLGPAQLALSTALIAGAALFAGQTPAAAVVFGAALSLSSTAMVVPALAEAKLQSSPVGRYAFAVLLFQDLAVAPLLFMVSMLGGGGADGFAWKLTLIVAPAALAVAAVILIGRLALRPLFRSVALTGSPEFFMAACLLVVLGAALIAAASGLSMALGAFLAGLLLAETEYRREIEVTIEPFKGLLLGLFFVSVGAELDLSLALERPVAVFGALAALRRHQDALVLPAGAAVRREQGGVARRRAGARPRRRIRLRADRGRSRGAPGRPGVRARRPARDGAVDGRRSRSSAGRWARWRPGVAPATSPPRRSVAPPEDGAPARAC